MLKRVVTGRYPRHLPRRSVVAIGMFDGVHLGHQHLIKTAVRLAKRAHAASVVVTFHPDPQHILDPRHAPRPMMLLEDRVRLISALGVDRVWVIPFTLAFSKRSAEQFVEEVLVKQLHACGVVVGTTFSFGNQRRGTLELLRELGRRHGLRVVIVAPVRRGGELVSSSRIRRLIQAGELEEAHRLLGRPVELRGKVVRGAGRARTLGFPTANVRLTSTLLPPRGVYQIQCSAEISLREISHFPRNFAARNFLVRATSRTEGDLLKEPWASARGGMKPCAEGESMTYHARQGMVCHGVMNLGWRPTFAAQSPAGAKMPPLICEAHLVGFRGNLYGRSVVIRVLKRLRDEQRFDSPQDLARQIQRDLLHITFASRKL